MNTKELIAKYLEIRDKRDALKAEHAKEIKRFNDALAKVEEHFLKHFNEAGEESTKTAAGTAYRTVRTSAKVADRDAFLAFVMESGDLNFLENRVNKTAVEEYMKEHDTLPPGVDVTRAVTVNIRRS